PDAAPPHLRQEPPAAGQPRDRRPRRARSRLLERRIVAAGQERRRGRRRRSERPRRLARRSPCLRGAMSASRLNPFPGPKPYTADERARFFGREEVAKDLENRVLAYPCLLLHGPSGAGKSSLMQAAAIPDLEDERSFRTVRVDTWPTGEAPLPWLVSA